MTGTVLESPADPGVDLAQWAASGDRQALDRALAAAADPAYAQAFRLLGRAADADDATQEALVQLVRSARRFDASRPFRPWLSRLVHDACCRLLRSDRRRRRREAEVAMEAAVPPPSRGVDADAVRAAVLGLPEPLRAAVELHYFAGLSQAEAAAALGIGEGACAMRLSRARDRLRGLLDRSGVVAAPAIALAVITAAPAHAAPPALATAISAQAVAGTLPATTIPLTLFQTGAMFMSSHPVITCLSAALLCAAAIIPFTLHAGESPPPEPALPVTATSPAWSAPAQALLPYLDPKASFLLAMDLQGIRPGLLQTKPFSLLAEPTMAPVIARWFQVSGQARGKKDRMAALMLSASLQVGRAAVWTLHDASTGGNADARNLLLLDLGDRSDIWRQFQPSKEAKTIGPFAGVVTNKGVFLGQDGPRLALAASSLLQGRIGAQAAAPPSAPIWFRYDAGGLVASYAALSGPDGDPAAVGPVLGPKWRTLRPLIEGRIRVAKDGITSEMTASKAAPFSPLLPLALLWGGTAELPIGALASAPLRRPTIGIPTSADGIASFSLGLTIPKDPEFPLAAPLANLILGVWSGDIACEIRPGTPLPKAALVFGLRNGVSGDKVIASLASALGGEVDAQAHPAKATVLVAGGVLTMVAHRDRMVLTFNAEPEEWPGIASAPATATKADCSAMIDLPAVVRAWWPLLQMSLSSEERTLLPPQPLLVAHLPVWRMDWTATRDGCRVIEHGLPLITAMAAAASVRIVLAANPESETSHRQDLLQQQPSPEPEPETF